MITCFPVLEPTSGKQNHAFVMQGCYLLLDIDSLFCSAVLTIEFARHVKSYIPVRAWENWGMKFEIRKNGNRLRKSQEKK